MIRKILGGLLIGAGVVTLGLVWQNNNKSRELPFSPYTILYSSWEKYKNKYIVRGRVIDYSEQSVTTSEGQSYAMWRAVLVDDRASFDEVWQWTKNNLQRKEDKLFVWRWGERKDGVYGALENGGENSASDADQDIALSLIQAGRRWGDERYTDEARQIIKDIFRIEISEVEGQKRYLTAGNWASNEDEIYVNPSYFYPYAWRIFAEIDRENNWNDLIGPAYELLTASGQAGLDKASGSGLPPDWLVVNRKNGEIRAADEINLTTNYSYDAMRVPFRAAVDYAWNKDERAKKYLFESFEVLEKDYETRNRLASSYSHDGKVIETIESPSMYATAMGFFQFKNPEVAKKIYEEKIIGLYSNDSNNFREDLPYYDQNWLWFGAALYNDFLKKI